MHNENHPWCNYIYFIYLFYPSVKSDKSIVNSVNIFKHKPEKSVG